VAKGMASKGKSAGKKGTTKTSSAKANGAGTGGRKGYNGMSRSTGSGKGAC
jgi:hypothetical protein